MILSPALNRVESRDMSGNVTARSYTSSGSSNFTNITIQPYADISAVVNANSTGSISVSRPTNSAFNPAGSFVSLNVSRIQSGNSPAALTPSQIQTAGTPTSASAATFTVAATPTRLTSINQTFTLPSPSVAVFANAGGTPYADLSSYLASNYYTDTQVWRMPIITQSKSLFPTASLLSTIPSDVVLASKDTASLSTAPQSFSLNADGSVSPTTANAIQIANPAPRVFSTPVPMASITSVAEFDPNSTDTAFWQVLLGSQSSDAFVDEEAEQIAQTTGIGYVQAQARIDEQTSLAARQASTLALVKAAFTQYQVGFEETYRLYAENKAQEAGRKAKESAYGAAFLASVASSAVSTGVSMYISSQIPGPVGGALGGAIGGIEGEFTYDLFRGRASGKDYLIAHDPLANLYYLSQGDEDAKRYDSAAAKGAATGAAAGWLKGIAPDWAYKAAGAQPLATALTPKQTNEPAPKRMQQAKLLMTPHLPASIPLLRCKEVR